MKRRFIQCDVFSATPYRGNPLAVVIDGEGLSDNEMQGFASWTNLSETTFLLPPEDPSADYKVRIFTPAEEMPFAGHPTLGSCAAWLESGGQPQVAGRVVQECNIGLVTIDTSESPPAFIAPDTTISPMSEKLLATLIKKVGLHADSVVQGVVLNNGPSWQLIELDSAESVLAVKAASLQSAEEPDAFASGFIGLVGPHASGRSTSTLPDFEVRLFAPESGIVEDPITGSLNAAIAKWLDKSDRLPEKMVVSQGTALAREGRVYIRRTSLVEGDHKQPDIMIGGQTHILIKGHVEL